MRENGFLQGLILRKRIAMLFAHKAFGLGPPQPASPAESTENGGLSHRGRTLSKDLGDVIHTIETQESTELMSPLVTWDMLEKP